MGKQRFSRRSRKSEFKSAGEGDAKKKSILNEEKILCLFISPILACFAGRLFRRSPRKEWYEV